MIKSLTIQNYALIDSLHIEFGSGFTTITGETGAGKSIILGAISLLLGQRADSDILLDKTRKCIVEAMFETGNYNLEWFFEQNEIDYNPSVIIRREILENGRSRAFVNDTPVNLTVLKELGDKLIDVHSQHQSSYLTDWSFQLKIIDIGSGNLSLLQQYKESFRTYNELKKKLNDIKEKALNDQKDYDYIQFQYNELENAKIREGEEEELEETFKVLSNVEEIKVNLSAALEALLNENTGAIIEIKEALSRLNKLKNVFNKADQLHNRLESVYLELKDITNEMDNSLNSIELDPEKLEATRNRLDFLYHLCQKHRVSKSDELILLKEKYSERLSNISSYNEIIDQLTNELQQETEKLRNIALKLREGRKKSTPVLEEKVTNILRQLGMPNAVFNIVFEELPEFHATGLDAVNFLFSANKQVSPQDIAKVASGGEISRLMLAIKSVIASSIAMPAIVFDEIDTGVSGEIADRMANIMKEMAQVMQVISITHLPQVAAKGKYHYLVYKSDTEKSTNTYIKLLSEEERVYEIAKMLSGKNVTEAAINNAKILISS